MPEESYSSCVCIYILYAYVYGMPLWTNSFCEILSYLQILHLVMSHDEHRIMHESMVMHHKPAIHAESLLTITVTTVYTHSA